MVFKRRNSQKGQLELHLARPIEKDRNFALGGRSFYFFDFDDNIAILSTPTYLFHKETEKELVMSSGDFARQSSLIGKSGILKDYKINFDDEKGSFRNFRDRDLNAIHRLAGKKQYFIEDLMSALGCPLQSWKGPSWQCFYHAVLNQRPLSLITARGHHPDTIKKGMKKFVKKGYLPHEPNYLSIYPVNHPKIRNFLNPNGEMNVAELKRVAIRRSVEKAFEIYGKNDFHRFGMSDDDPKNIDLIIQEMTNLKIQFPKNSFFVIETHNGEFFKREIFGDHTESKLLHSAEQLDLPLK